MVITKTYNNKFKCDWFHCKIKNQTYSSPILENVEVWRDDRVNNAKHYEELERLNSEWLAYQYNNNHNNWTGD
jgi:hypothetical protein